MTICLKTSSAGSASEGFSDMHAETARMSGITNRVLQPVPDAEARKPIRGRHNLRYAIEKPWVEPGAFLLPVVGIGQMSRYRWFSIALARQKLRPLVCRQTTGIGANSTKSIGRPRTIPGLLFYYSRFSSQS